MSMNEQVMDVNEFVPFFTVNTGESGLGYILEFHSGCVWKVVIQANSSFAALVLMHEKMSEHFGSIVKERCTQHERDISSTFFRG